MLKLQACCLPHCCWIVARTKKYLLSFVRSYVFERDDRKILHLNYYRHCHVRTFPSALLEFHEGIAAIITSPQCIWFSICSSSGTCRYASNFSANRIFSGIEPQCEIENEECNSRATSRYWLGSSETYERTDCRHERQVGSRWLVRGNQTI